MTENELLCLELSMIEGIGLKRIADLYAAFGSAASIWSASEKELRRVIPEKPVQALLKGPDPEKVKALTEKWYSENVQFYTRESPEYPHRLQQIYDAPPVLFFQGNGALLRTEMMAVVGARRCTPYGRQSAEEIGYRLAKSGYTVVSGMAYGIDAYSHQGALKAHGNTIAVLANGVDICYPRDHYRLWQQIREQGLLVSEYPPGVQPRAGFFPLRNRIISGLSCGVVIVEAAARSGSLITADQALEQGRDVYCVPGSIYSSMSHGVHRLVQQGAILLSCMEDLPAAAEVSVSQKVELTKNEQAVYEVIGDTGASMQTIVNHVELSFQELLQIVSLMEIRGVIEQSENQKWIRSKL